jgi:hypothetical protein
MVTSTQSLRLRMERRRQAIARASAVRVTTAHSLRQNEDHQLQHRVAGSTIACPKGAGRGGLAGSKLRVLAVRPEPAYWASSVNLTVSDLHVPEFAILLTS